MRITASKSAGVATILLLACATTVAILHLRTNKSTGPGVAASGAAKETVGIGKREHTGGDKDVRAAPFDNSVVVALRQQLQGTQGVADARPMPASKTSNVAAVTRAAATEMIAASPKSQRGRRDNTTAAPPTSTCRRYFADMECSKPGDAQLLFEVLQSLAPFEKSGCLDGDLTITVGCASIIGLVLSKVPPDLSCHLALAPGLHNHNPAPHPPTPPLLPQSHL